LGNFSLGRKFQKSAHFEPGSRAPVPVEIPPGIDVAQHFSWFPRGALRHSSNRPFAFLKRQTVSIRINQVRGAGIALSAVPQYGRGGKSKAGPPFLICLGAKAYRGFSRVNIASSERKGREKPARGRCYKNPRRGGTPRRQTAFWVYFFRLFRRVFSRNSSRARNV